MSSKRKKKNNPYRMKKKKIYKLRLFLCFCSTFFFSLSPILSSFPLFLQSICQQFGFYVRKCHSLSQYNDVFHFRFIFLHYSTLLSIHLSILSNELFAIRFYTKQASTSAIINTLKYTTETTVIQPE